MSWYSVGAEAAERVAASTQSRRTKNFWTKHGESAIVRFLTPASESFNYKRGYVKYARGQKLYTSPEDNSEVDPFKEVGIQLQAAFAWKVIDRRILEFKDNQTGEDKKVGPRLLFFADGSRTRKQLMNLEREMLIEENERREEDGKAPITLDEFNLTHYDLKVSKDKDAPWNLIARRPKPLSKDDGELIEKYDFKLEEELAPLSLPELKMILRSSAPPVIEKDSAGDVTEYSYEDEEDEDNVKFDDKE